MSIKKEEKQHYNIDKKNHGNNGNKDKFLPLAHWLRREILITLKDEDLTFTNLLDKINKDKKEKISKSRLHQHLEILVNGKFLRRFRESGHTWYVLNPDKLKEISQYILDFIT